MQVMVDNLSMCNASYVCAAFNYILCPSYFLSKHTRKYCLNNHVYARKYQYNKFPMLFEKGCSQMHSLHLHYFSQLYLVNNKWKIVLENTAITFS